MAESAVNGKSLVHYIAGYSLGIKIIPNAKTSHGIYFRVPARLVLVWDF
jgi:hypothetical protein